MATLVALLDTESAVESAWTTLFGAAMAGTSVIGTDTASEVVTPRVECVATVTKWGPHQHTIASGTFAGRPLYDQFLVSTDLRLVFQPEHAQGQGSLRGALRKALTDWTGIQAAFATLGYYFPAPDTLRQTGGDRQIDNEEKTETISTTLELVVFLSPAALLAAT